MPRPVPAISIDARDEHLGQAQSYVTGGVPLEAEACVDLIKNPEAVLAQIGVLSKMIEAAAQGEVGAPALEPGAQERLEKLQALGLLGLERGYGTDYKGRTAGEGRGDLPASSVPRGGNSLGHRRRTHTRPKP